MIKLLTIISVILLVVFFILAANHGLKLHEINECLTWQNESEIYPNYQPANWQVEQCLNYEISL